MAQPAGPQSEPPPTAKQRLFKRFFGGSRRQNESSSQPPASQPSPAPSEQQPTEDNDEENVEAGDPVKMNNGRHARGSVVPGLPRAQTFKRQLSESRAHLAPVQPSIDERRAVSMDRRFNSSRSRASGCPTDEPEASDIDLEDGIHNGRFPLRVPPFRGPDFPGGSLPDTTASHDTSTGHVSATPDTISDSHSITDSEYEVQIRHELEKKWILNLSMHFKDRSQREKFFVTYRESEHVWRRVTVSLDYRNAPPNSLETDLIYTKFQRDKNQKIYEAIRESLPDIHFFETVTNLKLETTEGRLHVHVVEDGNEIINYPPVSQVQHLGCRRIRESDVEFHSHMSGFVYKVKVGGQILIKKEIPSPETIEEFLYEINALNSLGYSENVINFHGVVVDEYDEYVKGLLISYADGGALIDVIYDNCKDPNGRGLGWEVRERWARQIVQGLADIHESGFVQGDFTLSNIVVDHKDDAKIIDINRRGCPVGWEPPEATPLLESNHRISMYIGIKSDLYQLGMVLWALAMEEDEPDLEGRPLFLGPEVKVPDWYRQLTETCLSPDPRRRLQASQLTHMFPPEANRRDQASADDVASTGSYYADDYTVGRAASERTQYDPRYLPAGAQAYEPWNYAPRGRSPPSPLPSNPDLSESHRSVTSPTAWAAHRFIRSSYSDAGVDDVRNDDINQTLTPTPTADRIEFPAGELCIEPDDADAPNEDPLADATPTEAKDIVSSKYQVPEVSADVLATTTADTGGIDNDLSKMTVAHEAKSSEADLLDEGQIGAESVVDPSETSGPLTEISPNIVSKDIPQEVEVLASKGSDEPVVDKQPAADIDEAAVATSSSAEDIIPSVPTGSTPTNGTSGAADTIDVTDKEKPQTEEDGQIVTIDGPKSDGSVEVEAPAKETAAEAPTEPTDETSPVDEPKDSATEVDIAKDEIQAKDVQDESATVANTLVNEVIPDQETAVEREVEQGDVDDPSKDITPDAAEDSSLANSASEEPAASPDASKANDVPSESSPDNNQAETEPRKVESSPADDKEEKTSDHNNEETEHASSKEEVQDPSDPPINPEPEALEEVIQQEEKVAEIKDVLSTETETQPQEPADMRDPPEPVTVANVDGQEEQGSEKVTAPDDTVPVEPKTTEAEAQSTKDDDTATSEDTVIVAKDVEPISVPPQDTDHTNVDATVSVQPTKSDLPDSLTGAGSGQPDIQPNLASQDDTILEEDFQVVSRSEPVST